MHSASSSSCEELFRDDESPCYLPNNISSDAEEEMMGAQEQQVGSSNCSSISSSSSQGGSSGYASGGSNSEDGICSIPTPVEAKNDEENEHRAHWVAGKRHANEDDTRASWRKHKKHFFILSHSGKPIFSRYGDEHKLAGFSATLQAIMSFVENSGDRIKYVRAGDHQILFLVKGPIYLVSISATEEPLEALNYQLELLYGQLLLILTKSLEKCFMRNSKFDMKPLLGGTEVVFSSLIQSFSWNFATFLHAYTCLPLPYTTRQAAGAALQDAADQDVLFALLICGSKVVSLSGAQKATLHPDDILLLTNFVTSSVSFRTAESFSPVCLPRYNAAAFMYAYVNYLDNDTCLILLTTNPDGFFHLKDCRTHIERKLSECDVFREIEISLQKGGLKVEDLACNSALETGAKENKDQSVVGFPGSLRHIVIGVGGVAGLLHFVYRSIYLDQYVTSEYSAPLCSRVDQKRLFRAYERLHASMHNGSTGSQKMQYRRDENYVLLSWSTQEFDLLAAFDPLAEKSSAVTSCNQICQWLRDMERENFLLGQSPFSSW